MTLYNDSAIQRLLETSDGMEIWWDSSPLIFKAWSEQVLKKTSDKEKDIMAKWLRVLFDDKKPENTLFSGVTTNPRLTRKVLDLVPEDVNPTVDKIIKENPFKTNYELAWKVYKEITKEGTKLYMPLFKKTNYRKGYVSAQVDPRLVKDVRKMLGQALELSSISPNIIVKCPGSKEGIYLIQILTSLGIPTNATLVFNVPQVVQVAEAVKRGYEIGISQGTDFSQWRSVITIMMARFEDREPYVKSAKEVGIELTDELKRWTGIAIAKKAHKILNDKSNGYHSNLLLCSSRVGPEKDEVLHIEKVAGGNLVYTINPEMIDDFMRIYKEKDICSQIASTVPDEIMNRLTKIPYFNEGYAEYGIKIEDFVNHPSFVFTKDQFSDSMKEIEEYVIERKKEL